MTSGPREREEKLAMMELRKDIDDTGAGRAQLRWQVAGHMDGK